MEVTKTNRVQPVTATPHGMRTFFIIWIGQVISMIGSGMTGFALGVWVFQQTGQATPLALNALFASIPRLLLQPVAGSLADRWNRRYLMLLADCGNALVTLTALLLLWVGHLQIWHIYLITATGSAFLAFQDIAYMTSVALLAPKKDLARANSMVHMAEGLQWIVAPLLAGLLFGRIGLRGIIQIDFVTFFIAISALLLVRIPAAIPEDTPAEERAMWDDFTFGFRYLRARPALLRLILSLGAITFLYFLASVLTTPLVLSFAGPESLGLVQTLTGVGLLAGTAVLSAWGGPQRRMRGMFVAITLTGCGLAVAGLRPAAWLIGAGLFLTMFANSFTNGLFMAILQSKIEPAVQGRVFAVQGMLMYSGLPLAFLVAGPLADHVFGPLLKTDGALAGTLPGALLGVGAGRGVGLMLVLAGLSMVAAMLFMVFDPHVRGMEAIMPDVIES